MKKIAFVVALPGSAQAFLKNHFEKLTKIYDVYLVANFPNEESKREFEEMGVTCLNAPIMRPIRMKDDLKALFVLNKIFKEEKFESVHSVTPKAGLLTSISGRMAGVKTRIHIFTGQVWATRKGAMRTLLKMMDKVIAKLDTHILVDGESQRQFLIKEGVLKAEKSKVLANGSICGVKLNLFDVSEEIRNNERAKFKFRDDDVVFIFMGRLNHDKGIGELYEAFNKLASEYPKAKLSLFGIDEGGYAAKIKDFQYLKIAENVFLTKWTPTPFNALQGGDIFVLPTWREGFGSSVIEAQALGLPVITSDAFGVIDASVPNKTGLRFHVGDSEGLYQCMKTYCKDMELAKKHGRAGRMRVFEMFDSELVSKAWVEYYKSIVK